MSLPCLKISIDSLPPTGHSWDSLVQLTNPFLWPHAHLQILVPKWAHLCRMPTHTVTQDFLSHLGEIMLPHASVFLDVFFLCFNSCSFFFSLDRSISHIVTCVMPSPTTTSRASHLSQPEIMKYPYSLLSLFLEFWFNVCWTSSFYPPHHWISPIFQPFVPLHCILVFFTSISKLMTEYDVLVILFLIMFSISRIIFLLSNPIDWL